MAGTARLGKARRGVARRAGVGGNVNDPDSEVLNPVEIEQLVRRLSNEIARGVRVVSAAHGEWKKKLQTYEKAVAMAYVAYEGPAHQKKYAAELATQDERTESDAAEVAFRHAERHMKALEIQLSAAQTIAKSIMQMYGASGRTV